MSKHNETCWVIKITERKIVQVSRKLPEFIIKRFFLLPEVRTFIFFIQIKSLAKYVATLVFHLVSACSVMVSPPPLSKGLNAPNSIQGFLKLHTMKEKLSTASHCTWGHLQPSSAIVGHICMATKAKPNENAAFSRSGDNYSEVLKVSVNELVLKGTNRTWRTRGKKRDSVDKSRLNTF